MIKLQKIEETPILGKVFKQTFWQIIGKVFSSISTFIILGIIARNYKEAGVGIFTLSLTYLAMFNLLSDFGFNAHVLKKFQISNFKFQIEEFRHLLGTRLLWSIILLVVSIILLPILPFATKEFSLAVIFGSLAILGFSVYISCNLIFQSKHRYDLSVLASIIGSLVGLGLYTVLSLSGYQIPFLLFAYSASWAVTAFWSLALIKRFCSPLLPIFDTKYTKSLFKETWPIAATLALNVVYFRADSFLISFYKGVSEVGIYNVAYSIFQSTLVLPTFIMNAYYPLMLRSLKSAKMIGFGLMLISILATFFVFQLAPFLISTITGGGFLGSTESLQILSLSFPAFFMSSLLMWLLIKKGQYKRMLTIYTFGLLINLVLNFIFIPKFSYIAASWITGICEYLILILLAVSVI